MRLRGIPDGHDLGVSCGIVGADRLVEPLADHPIVEHHDSSDRHLAHVSGAHCQAERLSHEPTLHYTSPAGEVAQPYSFLMHRTIAGISARA